MLPLFAWQGTVVCSTLICRMGDQLDTGPRVAESTLRKLEMLELDVPEHPDDESDAAKREAAVDGARRVLRADRLVAKLPEDQQDARVRALTETWRASGTAAFRGVDPLGILPGPEYWPSGDGEARMVSSCGMFYLLLAGFLLLVSLGSGNQDLGQVEWRMLWLAALPVPTRTLFWSKVVEYVFIAPFLWAMALPFSLVYLVCAGHGWRAVPLALLATLSLGFLVASSRVVIETWLRMHLDLTRLKNVQAGCTFAGLAMMVMLYGCAFSPEMSSWFLGWAPRFSAVWFPVSAPALLGSHQVAWPIIALGLAACAALAAQAAVVGCSRLVREGFVVQGGAFQGQRPAHGAAAPAGRARGGAVLGVLGKDLLLLGRDRNFLVQALAVPAFIVGLQLVVNHGMLSSILTDFRHAAAFAYVFGAYLLMNTAIGILNLEGGSLWLLYAAPQPIERVLVRKTMLWAGIGCVYCAVVLVAAACVNPHLEATAVSDALMALSGIVVYAFIAGGIGALTSDPLENIPQRRVKPGSIYLFMLLSGLYAYAIYNPSAFGKLAQLALSSLLAYALWQKVRDRIPYLLDPTAAPPPSLSLSDGLIAALAFFVMQALVSLLLLQANVPPAQAVTIAFATAGITVTLGCLYIFWRARVPDLLRTLGLRAAVGARHAYPRALAIGVTGAACASGAAWAYLRALDHFPGLRPDEADTLSSLPGAKIWLALLAVVAAPLCEEFIFRGLVFGGLRRTLPVAWAMFASAAIFALVHPPASVLPVFVLGLTAAAAYQLSGLLLSAVIVHAGYNAVVLWLAWG